jgi:putative phosphoribosyl transferase
MLFENRLEAGKILAKKLTDYKSDKTVVLAIPRGGVPVGLAVASYLDVPLDVIVVRKIPIPQNPEAGFGALAPDGTLVLNKPLVFELDLSLSEIKKGKAIVLKEIKRRIQKYKGKKPPLLIKGKTIILIDDGLASGYTMIAAIRYLEKFKPKKIIVAVPTAPKHTLLEIRPYAKKIICLNVSKKIPFAVADSYKEFPDLNDEEVIDYSKAASGKKELPKL